MRSVHWSVVLPAILAGWLVGCAPPTVAVEHVLPAALPMPADVAAVRTGDFAVRTGPKDGFAAFLKETLDKRLMHVPVGLGHGGPAAGPAGAARIPAAQVAAVGGEIDIQTADLAGKRTVRRRAAGTGELESVELATLVRTAAVRVELHVRRASDKEPLGTAEVRREYSSAADPLVRGELGLERPDDPARVPPAEAIVRRLLTECAEAFARMISPVVAKAHVPLRSAPGRCAQLGLAAARKANYAEAVKQFEAAVAAAPDDAGAHFDLAAVAEANASLDLAASHYARAWELSGRKDAEAKRGADRARRVLAAREPPKMPAD
jgi:hypothetical protein